MRHRTFDRGFARRAVLAAILVLAAMAGPVPAEAQVPAGTPASATGRAGINLVVILDVSTSMRGTFREMQDYVFDSVIGKILKTGDYFSLVTFGFQVTRVFAGTVELPRDAQKLKDAVYGMAAKEDWTDIGLMLEKLDLFLKTEKMPNGRTSIVWATDGKNEPPPGSRYVGKDVFDPKAFESYRIVKSSAYKVLLLSIGAGTAAKDLSGPMGGEYLEVGRDVTAEKLDSIMGDFTSSIEMSNPAGSTAQRATTGRPKVRFGFSSNFAEGKMLKVEKVLVSFDGGPRSEIESGPREISLPPKSRIEVEFALPLPAGLSKGEHVAEVELQTDGKTLVNPVQRVTILYEPYQSRAIVILVFVIVGIGAAFVVYGGWTSRS